MKSRLQLLAFVFVVLAVAGPLFRPLEAPMWQRLRETDPGFRVEEMEGVLGQGVSFGILGGFRAIAANLLWIRTNVSWEDLDIAQTQLLIRLTTTIDPRPPYFWINGSRMIAYDMPNWRFRRAGGVENVPESVQMQVNREQAEVAFRLLDAAQRFHPNNALFYIERANIHQRRLQDVPRAAELYLIASQQPDAPLYAARIHAELLRMAGDLRGAYDFYRKLLPTLDWSQPFARAWVVHERIVELENELNIPPEERYNGPVPQPVPY